MTSYEVLIAEYLMKTYQEKIRRGFMSQPFGDVGETPVRTATEMSMRHTEHMEMYQSAFGRLQTELLEQLLSRCIDILVRRGKIEPLEIDGKLVTVRFTSPMAKMQEAQDLQNLMQGIQYMSAIENPEAVNRAYKIEDIPGYIGDLIGLPESLKRSDIEKKGLDEIAKRGAVAKGKMQQQQMTQQGGQGE